MKTRYRAVARLPFDEKEAYKTIWRAAYVKNVSPVVRGWVTFYSGGRRYVARDASPLRWFVSD